MNLSKKPEKFRSAGLGVIHKQRINNISEFLSHSPERRKTDNGQELNSNSEIVKTGRLHLQVRQDLIDQILHEVFERKRDHTKIAREATQRAIIEEALEGYFKRKGNEVSIGMQ